MKSTLVDWMQYNSKTCVKCLIFSPSFRLTRNIPSSLIKLNLNSVLNMSVFQSSNIVFTCCWHYNNLFSLILVWAIVSWQVFWISVAFSLKLFALYGHCMALYEILQSHYIILLLFGKFPLYINVWNGLNFVGIETFFTSFFALLSVSFLTFLYNFINSGVTIPN